jgi:hypothetical protein
MSEMMVIKIPLKGDGVDEGLDAWRTISDI